MGTQEFPYRTMKLVASEILNFHSNSNVDIKIFTKSVYIQDDTMYFLNISSVSITSHLSVTKYGLRSFLIPTKISQYGIMGKSKFCLLKNVNLDLNKAIDAGNFTEFETELFLKDEISIMLLRTSLFMNKVNVFREEIVANYGQLFILAVYIQEKLVKIGKNIKKIIIYKMIIM